MRPCLCLALALLASSCANYQTCPARAARPRFPVALISDIDDTVKDTHVTLGETHIPNPTMVLDPFRRWRPVDGMAHFYQMRRWNQDHGVSVIYVSAGPCSYATRLEHLIPSWGFPRGEILLRMDAPFPPAPGDYKMKAIYPIISHSPGTHFILVGDSGEHDPECYGDLARKFPDQVNAIYIRKISGNEPRRYARVFAAINPKKIHFIPANLKSASGTHGKSGKIIRRYSS
jgi:phosphatidate phosphatase APP1